MREPSEEIARRVQSEVALNESVKAEATKTATALIQGYIGPDHKVVSMPLFHSALRRLFDKRENEASSITPMMR